MFGIFPLQTEREYWPTSDPDQPLAANPMAPQRSALNRTFCFKFFDKILTPLIPRFKWIAVKLVCMNFCILKMVPIRNIQLKYSNLVDIILIIPNQLSPKPHCSTPLCPTPLSPPTAYQLMFFLIFSKYRLSENLENEVRRTWLTTITLNFIMVIPFWIIRN